MSKREVKLYLTDIDDAVSAIRSYTKDMTYEQLLDDAHWEYYYNCILLSCTCQSCDIQQTCHTYGGCAWQNLSIQPSS